MSLATSVKEGKRKRKSVDTPSQSQDSKRLKSQDAEPTPESSSKPKAQKGLERQPLSNNSLTKEIQKKIGMESTEKPFPDPQNQSQTLANQAWRKQNVYRKRIARTEAKKEKKEEPAPKGEDKTEASEDAAERKQKKEKKQKVDKRKKKTDDHKVESDAPIASEVAKQEDVPVEPSHEIAVKKPKELKEDKRSNKPKKDIVTKKKERKEKKRKMVKGEEQDIKDVEMDLVPQGLAAERTVANRGNWASSKPVGGHFIIHDPVFSADEK